MIEKWMTGDGLVSVFCFFFVVIFYMRVSVSGTCTCDWSL